MNHKIYTKIACVFFCAYLAGTPLLKANEQQDITSEDFLNAAAQNDVYLVMKYLERGGDVNVTTNTMFTGLLHRILDANLQRFRESSMTALMFAAREGHIDVVNLLFDAGADANAITIDGWSAVMFAVHGGHADVVNTLFDRGNIEMHVINEAVMFAAREGHVDFVNFLIVRADRNTINEALISTIRRGFEGYSRYSPRTIANRNNYLNTVHILVNALIDAEYIDMDIFEYVLIWAVRSRYTNITETLLERLAWNTYPDEIEVMGWRRWRIETLRQNTR